MTSPISQEIQDIQQAVGLIIRGVRMQAGLRTTDLARKLHYDPSAVSKAERGTFVSGTFIEKFLLTMVLDAETATELNRLKEALRTKQRELRRHRETETCSSIAKEDVPHSEAVPLREQIVTPVEKHERSWAKILIAFCTRRWEGLLIVFVLMLVTSIALVTFWPRQPTILGPLDFDWGCQEQYGPGSQAVILNVHDVYTWRCTVHVTEPSGETLSTLTGVDTNAICRKQYKLPKAWSASRSEADAYSWYCYLP